MVKYKIKTKECQLIVKAKLSSSEKIDERELYFFTRKYIRGLLKPQMEKKFGFTSIEYTGPIGISLFERLQKPITKYDFLFIIEQIVDISQKVQMNYMSLNKVVWDIHNIFINETTREMQFIYLPLENMEKEADIMALIDSVVYSTKPAQEQNSEYISRFVYFLKGIGEEATTLLENSEQVHASSLFRVRTEENISINKPVFRLGKEKSYADYFVSNNNAVSRSHAEIITRGQSVFVIDLNSKNKTYINDQPIPAQQEIEIFNGDRLRLANEEFIFSSKNIEERGII